MTKPKIGLLGATLSLYQQRLPALMPALEKIYTDTADSLAPTMDVIRAPLVWDADRADKTFLRFETEGVAGVIVVCLSYAASLTLVPAARKYGLPLLIWSTQNLAGLDRTFKSRDLLENHGMHGAQDLASVLLREDIPFHFLCGYRDNPGVRAGLADWSRAAAAVAELKSARVGRIGGAFPDMGDFSMEPARLRKVLGPVTVELPAALLAGESITTAQGISLQEELGAWTRDPKVTPQIEDASLRAAVSLQRLADETQLAGLTVNFQGLGDGVLMPFLGLSLLLKKGLGYAGEGDIYAATAVRLAHLCSDNQATFTEMFTTDYAHSRIFMSHMGECNVGLRRTDPPIRLAVNPMAFTNNVPTLVPVFSLRPGDATLLNLTGTADGRLKCIVTRADVEDEPPLPEFTTPHFLIRPRRPVEEFLTAYSTEGGTHHLALAYGDIRPRLKYFAAMKNIPYVEI